MRRARKGNALFIIAGGLTVLLGASAFVVDLASGLESRTRQQSAADAAALAACYQVLPPNTAADATQAAVDWAARNQMTISAANVAIGPGPAGQPATTVTIERQVPTAFARVLGPQFATIDVKAVATATLGGLIQIPPGALPFGVPACTCNNEWNVLTSLNPVTFAPLSLNPATTFVVFGSGNGKSGNLGALSIGGNGANTLHDAIVSGLPQAIDFGSVVGTKPGQMAGPVQSAIAERLAAGNTQVMIPLIDRWAWEAENGRSDATIIGFVMAKLNPALPDGTITATFMNKVFDAPGVATNGLTKTPGAYAPVLIPTPQQ